MFRPSLQFLETALVVMALCSFVMGVGMFFLMQVRYSRNLARGTKRLSFANLIGSTWDAKHLEELWALSPADDREAIEDVLVSEAQLAREGERAAFQKSVTSSSIYAQWLKRLGKGSTSDRARAARLLGHFPDERGIQALTAGLRNPSSKVVLACVVSLGRLRNPSSLPALLSSLPSMPRTIPDVTLTAVLAGCAREEPKGLADLLKLPDDRLRLLGAWALSEVADATVLTDLVAAAADAHPEVRAKVARCLARIPDQVSLDTLKRMTRDSVWFVRYRALHALGELHAPEGFAVAMSALNDEVREVRYGAAGALRKIRGMKTEIVVEVLRNRSKLSFDSLISEWDRAGFLYEIAQDLAVAEVHRAKASRELLRLLIASGVSSTLESFVLLYPSREIRLILASLLLETPQQEVRERVRALASDPRCDPGIAQAIMMGVGRANPDHPEAGSV